MINILFDIAKFMSLIVWILVMLVTIGLLIGWILRKIEENRK